MQKPLIDRLMQVDERVKDPQESIFTVDDGPFENLEVHL